MNHGGEMARTIIISSLIIAVLVGNALPDDKTLQFLKSIDTKIVQLEDSIRVSDVGWGKELITSAKTNDFEAKYQSLRILLAPGLTLTIQNVRERTENLATMGQILTSLPGISSDMMTVIDYENRLNHIEFLLNSRRSTIATRLSILIAILFGALSIIFGTGSLWLSISGNRKSNKRLSEIIKLNDSILKKVTPKRPIRRGR